MFSLLFGEKFNRIFRLAASKQKLVINFKVVDSGVGNELSIQQACIALNSYRDGHVFHYWTRAEPASAHYSFQLVLMGKRRWDILGWLKKIKSIILEL